MVSASLVWFGRACGAGCGSCGLFITPAGWVRHLWAGDLVPTALAAGWLGASGLGGWVQAERAAASSPIKTDVKGKPIQHRGRGRPSGERKAASLLENCGSSKA